MGEQQISKCQPDPDSFTALIQDRLRQFCKFVESLRGGRLMHYLDATPPRSPIRPFCRFLGGAHFRRGRGAEDVVGRPDGRTLASLRPSGRCRHTLLSQVPDCRLQLPPTAIRAQPAVCGHWLVTLSVASCSRAAVRGKAGTVTGGGGRAGLMLLPLQFAGDGTTAELQYPLLHKDLLILFCMTLQSNASFTFNDGS